MDLLQYSLRIAFLKLDGFQLELVEFKPSVSYEAIQKRFPVVDDRAKIQGLGKLAFLVEDIEAVAAKMKSHIVKFERDITDDKEFVAIFIIAADNSGNWINSSRK
jgi:hypothetical protein